MSIDFSLVKNKFVMKYVGTAQLKICYIFADPPDAPTRVKIVDVSKGIVTLTWKPPRNDGGSPVTHYNVERLWWDSSGEQKESWRQCNRRDIDTTSFKIEDLHEGAEYEFRVKAVNEAGASRPSSTAGPIIVKEQTSM